MNNRIIVIGLDGATFTLINPLLQNGKLPYISKLVKNGVRATLLSTIPYATIPAWPSFMTGMNPAKYGVFDFFGEYANGRRRIIRSYDIRAKTIWEILSDYGKRSVVMNVPGTYPPQKINGIVVSGMLTPENSDFVEPKDIKQFLDDLTGGYRIFHDVGLPPNQQLISDLFLITEKQKLAFLSLLKDRHWNFAMMMFSGTDVVQHIFWGEGEIVNKFYQFMDLVIGEIIAAFPDAAIILMSDHGFQPQERDFHINKWLIGNGFMAVKPGIADEEDRFDEIGKLVGRKYWASDIKIKHKRNCAKVLLENLGFTKANLRHFVPNALWTLAKKILPEWIKGRIPTERNLEIDWSKTKASAFQRFGSETKAITINLKGREPQGIVEPSEYENIRTQIIEGLSEINDQDGTFVVKKAWRKEELYSGPYLEKAPDIVLELNNGYNITNSFVANNFVTKLEKLGGCHHREGILIAAGEEINQQTELRDEDVFIWDLAPTILHYLGCPVPEDCDGRVLREIFEEGSDTGKREVAKIQMKIHRDEEESQITEDQQKGIEKRLRELGYL